MSDALTFGPVAPGSALAWAPLPRGAVRLDPTGDLGAWQERNALTTLPHAIAQLEESGTLGNLRRARDRTPTPFRGYHFADSDVYKTCEAVAWEIGRSGTRAFDAFLDDVVALLRAVQRPDGYLSSWTQGSGLDGGPVVEPFSDPRWGHELYCFGHLIQAGVALDRAAGRDDLLAVARATADLLVRRRAERGVTDLDGHPEVETALVELFRHTGERAYLDLAGDMVAARGHGTLGPDRLGPHYFQDHAPVADSLEATGHAVRQLYLNAGVEDVLAEGSGDPRWFDAMAAQWRTAHDQKMYVTGAMGSRHFDESFGDAYELPPDRAYAETCASIADVQWTYRMLLREPRREHGDAIERALHNSVRSAVSASGTEFFYSNPLHLRAGHREEENAPSRRTPWYHCACCPPNIARLVASLDTYVATASADELAVHLLAAGEIDVPEHLGSGTLSIQTAYPAEGALALRLAGTLRPGATVAVRVPGWAEGVEADDDGFRRFDDAALAGGVTITLPMDVVARHAHPRADAVRGCVALTRGPLVYCVEQADVVGHSVEDVRVALDAAFEVLPGLAPSGLPALRAQASAVVVDAAEPYPAQAPAERRTPVELTAVPYADWGNRSPGPMRVWVPVA